MERKCQHCSKSLHGRSDKKFCDLNCKNAFNFGQRRQTRSEVKEIDGYLHRNREILAILMGSSRKEMFDRAILTRAKFRWEFMTGIYWNKEGKMYRIICFYKYSTYTASCQILCMVDKAFGCPQHN